MDLIVPRSKVFNKFSLNYSFSSELWGTANNKLKIDF